MSEPISYPYYTTDGKNVFKVVSTEKAIACSYAKGNVKLEEVNSALASEPDCKPCEEADWELSVIPAIIHLTDLINLK